MTSRYKKGDLIDGRYRVLDELGQGGMGTVDLVEELETGKRAALKYATLDAPVAIQRFAREVRALLRISHPNVINVVGHNLEHDPPYFAMELAKAGLDKQMHAMTEEERLTTFIDVCRGVEAIHASLTTHRDLKPANILIFDHGRVAVSDFGLAKFDPRDTATLTMTGAPLGTYIYMAPEQFNAAKSATPAADIYALGKILCELLTLELPYIIDTSRLRPSIARVIRKATADMIPMRHPSVAELREAVENYLFALRAPPNPIASFKLALHAVTVDEANPARDRPRYQENVTALFGALAALDNDELLVAFDSITDVALQEAAAFNLPTLVHALESLVSALDTAVGARGYEYAEQVARRMRVVIELAPIPLTWALAIVCTMIVAHHLHRFAAYDELRIMMRNVISDEVARELELLLRQHEGVFALVAKQYAGDELHPILKALVDAYANDVET